MARNRAQPPVRSRTPATQPAAAAGAIAARAESHAPKKRVSPLQFFREVRAEAKKISWPSRRETWITTVMVMIMVVVTSIFFFVVDFGLSLGVSQLLKLGN